MLSRSQRLFCHFGKTATTSRQHDDATDTNHSHTNQESKTHPDTFRSLPHPASTYPAPNLAAARHHNAIDLIHALESVRPHALSMRRSRPPARSRPNVIHSCADGPPTGSAKCASTDSRSVKSGRELGPHPWPVLSLCWADKSPSLGPRETLPPPHPVRGCGLPGGMRPQKASGAAP